MGIIKELFSKKEELEEKVKLNGVEITKKQLNEKIKEAKQQIGVNIVEQKKGEYRTRIQG
jgi:hypothetical protein